VKERFDEFMQRALYDPQEGYYTQNISDVGGLQADFATSVTISEALGKTIAANLVEWVKKKKPQQVRVIEVGGGNGSLAEHIRQSLPLKIRWRMRLAIVDVSEPLRKIQQARLGKGVVWLKSMKEAMEWAEGEAFVYSNELVDAFPVRVFKREGQCLMELFVEKAEEHWELSEDFALSAALEVWTQWREGVRVEVCSSYRDWLQEWVPFLKRGRVVTVDYGDVFPEIYKGRPNGTLRGYWRHQVLDHTAIYKRVGEQDITVDVNFTDVRKWGEALGLRTLSYATQREFIQPYVEEREADQFVSMEEGAGEAFKVLVQEVGEK